MRIMSKTNMPTKNTNNNINKVDGQVLSKEQKKRLKKQKKRQKQKLNKKRKREELLKQDHNKYPCEVRTSNIPGAGMH